MSTPTDNPIQNKAEDQLGRAQVAEVLAREIRTIDASAGYVLGVLGPWGSGKTSLVNMVREELATAPAIAVVEFNPWMFSGTDQLLETFFLEIGAQFRTRGDRLSDLADDIEAYGEVVAPLRFLPVIGVWVERGRTIATAIRRALNRRKGGVLAKREALAKKLRELKAPVAVVIDDIDRLRDDEIRDIFKLVRLTAHFPNIIYLLAFDRERVEAALSEQGLNGRDYLEKILQIAYDIPAVPEATLTQRLAEELEESLKDIANPGPFDSEAWPDVLFEVIRPLIRNLRDVRRYVASLHATVIGLEGRVALVDVLGLEAVRVFLPDTFKALIQGQEALTTPRDHSVADANRAPLKEAIEHLIKASGERAKVARDLVLRLFPAGRRHIENMQYGSEWLATWLRKRRVAHPDVLRFYLERVAGDQLEAFGLAERAFEILAEGDELTAFLNSLGEAQLAETITALEVFEDEFPPASVEAASVALMNQLSRVPERPGGFFSVRPDIIVDRVVLRLLRKIESPEERETIVRRIFPRIGSLSARLDFLDVVGHRKGAGHKLISEEAAAELEAELRDAVRTAAPAELATEFDLFRLLLWTKRDALPAEPPFDLPANAEIDAALLKSAVSETRSQTMGSRAVRRSKALAWDALVELAGSEAAVRSMIDRPSSLAPDDVELTEALDLARRYREGWRPDND